MATQYSPDTHIAQEPPRDEETVKQYIREAEEDLMLTREQDRQSFVRNIDWASF